MALRKTRRQRMTAKLEELQRALRRRVHAPVRKQQVWLDSPLRSHHAWRVIAGNARSIDRFRTEALRARRYAPIRRGNRSRTCRPRFQALLLRFSVVPARIVYVRRCP